MHVLIIGGTRLSGPFVARELVARGHQVSIFHRGEQEAELPEGVAHLHGDCRDARSLKEMASSVPADGLLHMVPMNADDINNVVQAFGHRLKRAVFISSGDVYAAFAAVERRRVSDQPYPIPEDAPLRQEPYPPSHPPGYDKAAAERAALDAYARGQLPSTVLRYPAVYGPGASREWYWVKRILDKRPRIALPDGGLNIFHRGYAANVAHAVVLALESDAAMGQVYNVGDEQVYTVRQLTEMIARFMDHSWQIVDLPAQAWPYGTPYSAAHHILYDLSKIKTELGYRDVVSPEEALRQTIDHLRRQPPEITDPMLGPKAFDYEAEDAAIARFR